MIAMIAMIAMIPAIIPAEKDAARASKQWGYGNVTRMGAGNSSRALAGEEEVANKVLEQEDSGRGEGHHHGGCSRGGDAGGGECARSSVARLGESGWSKKSDLFGRGACCGGEKAVQG